MDCDGENEEERENGRQEDWNSPFLICESVVDVWSFHRILEQILFQVKTFKNMAVPGAGV